MKFRGKYILILLIAFAVTCSMQAQTTTIRIRFLNGKTGKPLSLKSYDHSDGRAERNGSYVVDKVERDSMVVSFKNTSNFYFRSEIFESCDSKTSETDQPKYDLDQIVQQGIVAPNFCGHTRAQPVPRELLIYSRHEHWWKVTGRVARGLLICA